MLCRPHARSTTAQKPAAGSAAPPWVCGTLDVPVSLPQPHTGQDVIEYLGVLRLTKPDHFDFVYLNYVPVRRVCVPRVC